MDVDGTLTDGKVYIGETGELFKSFNIKDGYGIAQILPKMGIEPVIITSRNSNIVQNRCKELGIKYIIQNVRDKLSALHSVLSEYNNSNETTYDLRNCAYIGDDVPDVECMRAIKKSCGIVACPHDAVKAVIEICDFVSCKDGGAGAVREFIEWFVSDLFYQEGDKNRKKQYTIFKLCYFIKKYFVKIRKLNISLKKEDG